jgi:hypothetical protein
VALPLLLRQNYSRLRRQLDPQIETRVAVTAHSQLWMLEE